MEHRAQVRQCWDAAEYAANGRFVADLAGGVVELLAPRPGERILDLGCGDGALTETLEASGAEIVGVDSSPEMVCAARARGLKVELRSAEWLEFADEFDAVFSNAALHWIRNQAAVLAAVHRALRPGGRFVGEMGGHGNIAAIRTALRATLAPYGVDAEESAASFFPTLTEYRGLLEGAGFRVRSIELLPRPTVLGVDMEVWLERFRKGVLSRLVPESRAEVVQKTVELLRPILADAEGKWTADYVRLRFFAERR